MYARRWSGEAGESQVTFGHGLIASEGFGRGGVRHSRAAGRRRLRGKTALKTVECRHVMDHVNTRHWTHASVLSQAGRCPRPRPFLECTWHAVERRRRSHPDDRPRTCRAVPARPRPSDGRRSTDRPTPVRVDGRRRSPLRSRQLRPGPASRGGARRPGRGCGVAGLPAHPGHLAGAQACHGLPTGVPAGPVRAAPGRRGRIDPAPPRRHRGPDHHQQRARPPADHLAAPPGGATPPGRPRPAPAGQAPPGPSGRGGRGAVHPAQARIRATRHQRDTVPRSRLHPARRLRGRGGGDLARPGRRRSGRVPDSLVAGQHDAPGLPDPLPRNHRRTRCPGHRHRLAELPRPATDHPAFPRSP